MNRTAAVLVAACIVALGACGSDDAATSTAPEVTAGGAPSPSVAETTASTRPAPSPGNVEIVDFDFVPRELTISRGQTVTWRNDDPYAHWVVATDPDVLDSGELSQAQTFSQTFTQATTVSYYCNIHNYMKATITVR